MNWELLLLRRIGGGICLPWGFRRWGRLVVLRTGWRGAEAAVAEASAVWGLTIRGLAIDVLHSGLPKSLQELWLVGCRNQTSLILGGIVNKNPVLVFLLFVVLPNRRIFAGRGHPDDGAANDLARGDLAASKRSASRAGRSCARVISSVAGSGWRSRLRGPGLPRI